MIRDHEWCLLEAGKGTISLFSINLAVASQDRDKDRKKEGKLFCHICNKKNHSALNCYNRFNGSKFPPQHSRRMNVVPTLVHLAASSTLEHITMWYPDSGATNHITANAYHIQTAHAFGGKFLINTAVGSLMEIVKYGNSKVFGNSRQYALNDILLVPSSTKNLLYVQCFCEDNNVCVEFNS